MSYNTTISFSVSHFSGLVIGPNGATIKALKEKHQLKKCFINNDNLILQGSTARCSSAKREVLDFIEQKRVQNRQQMDRYAMNAGANIQRKRLLKAEKKRRAEARLEELVQAKMSPKEETTTYTYTGKFNIDSDDEVSTERLVQGSWEKPLKVEESKEPNMTSLKKVTQQKNFELNRHGNRSWADICDDESDDEL